MKNLNGKQNLIPEKDVCSYLVKFYRTIDTVSRSILDYFVYLSCALMFPPRRHFKMSHALGFGR